MNTAFLTWFVLSAFLRLGVAIRTHPAEDPARHRPVVVVVDPGHGGSSKGACSPYYRICEKNVTLRLAQRLKAILETLPGVQVVLTRTTDHHRSLYTRAAIAEKAGGDLFLSLHVNASPKKDQYGFEAFVYPPLTAYKRLSLDRDPDSVPANTGHPAQWQVSTILADMRQQALRRCSVMLGEMVLAHLKKRVTRRNNRGLKQQHLAVLAGLKIPGVLVEAGFIDHPAEGPAIVASQSHQDIAEALRNAVKEWMEGPGRKACSPSTLDPEPHPRTRLIAPAGAPTPSKGKWKPKRWKSRPLPDTTPGPDKSSHGTGLLVWST